MNVARNMQFTVVLSDFIVPEFPTVLLIATAFVVSSAAVLLRKSKNTRKGALTR